MCEESWKLGNHYFYHVNIISYAYHAAKKLPPLAADSIELKQTIDQVGQCTAYVYR